MTHNSRNKYTHAKHLLMLKEINVYNCNTCFVNTIKTVLLLCVTIKMPTFLQITDRGFVTVFVVVYDLFILTAAVNLVNINLFNGKKLEHVRNIKKDVKYNKHLFNIIDHIASIGDMIIVITYITYSTSYLFSFNLEQTCCFAYVLSGLMLMVFSFPNVYSRYITAKNDYVGGFTIPKVKNSEVYELIEQLN